MKLMRTEDVTRAGNVRRMLTCCVLALLATLLLGNAPACMSTGISTTFLNKSDVPVMVDINGLLIRVVRPDRESRSFVPPTILPGSGYPGGPTVPPPNYVVTAYEFVVGKGNLVGWIDDNNAEVTGDAGDLIFSATYTWKELEKMKFTFVITRNVFPRNGPPGSSQ